VYGRLTGVPFPWNKYAQVTVADFIGGMENVSATTLVDWLPGPRDYRDRPWYRQSLGIDARRRMPLAMYSSNNVSPKGALVLEMLKTELGPERFWASMHRY